MIKCKVVNTTMRRLVMPLLVFMYLINEGIMQIIPRVDIHVIHLLSKRRILSNVPSPHAK